MSATAPTATDFYVREEEHHAAGGSTHLGFWIYLMSDCLIFAVLFATYGVLGASLAGGPGPRDLFELPLVALNTTLLLISSITYGFAMLAMNAGDQRKTLQWLAVTGALRRRLRRRRALRVQPPHPRGRRPAALGLPLRLLRAGRHPRAARHLRHRLADRAHGPGHQARADRRQPAADHLPVALLALPRPGLDRRLHLRLSAGSAAMSADARPRRPRGARRSPAPRTAPTATT